MQDKRAAEVDQPGRAAHRWSGRAYALALVAGLFGLVWRRLRAVNLPQ